MPRVSEQSLKPCAAQPGSVGISRPDVDPPPVGELGLLVPNERTCGEHRLYSSEDLRRLLAVQHLKSLGLSLTEVKAALDDPGFDASEALADHITTLEHRLSARQELLGRLRNLQGAA